jgi:hypothetical protein
VSEVAWAEKSASKKGRARGVLSSRRLAFIGIADFDCAGFSNCADRAAYLATPNSSMSGCSSFCAGAGTPSKRANVTPIAAGLTGRSTLIRVTPRHNQSTGTWVS